MLRLPITLTAAFALIAGACNPRHAPDEPVRHEVESAIAGLDAMRSGLAGTITAGQEVDAETFAQVCKPVGMQAKKLAEEKPMRPSTASGSGARWAEATAGAI